MRSRAPSPPAFAVLVSLLAVLAASFSAASVWAADKPPKASASAVSQYIEMVPTGSGPKAPGLGPEQRTQLPEKALRGLERTSLPIAAALEQIASSSDYGTPEATSNVAGADQTADPSLTESLQSAVGSGSDIRLAALLGVLLATTIGAMVLAARRRRI